MNELLSFQVELPKRKPLKIDLMNRRFIKMGFTRIQSLKKQSLPTIENQSILKRFKTEKSQEKYKYVNEFEELSYEQGHSSFHTMRNKKQLQPPCIYKKPRIKDRFKSYRKIFLPKVNEKGTDESSAKQIVDKNEPEVEDRSIRTTNQSSYSFNQNQLFTFYPIKLTNTRH